MLLVLAVLVVAIVWIGAFGYFWSQGLISMMGMLWRASTGQPASELPDALGRLAIGMAVTLGAMLGATMLGLIYALHPLR